MSIRLFPPQILKLFAWEPSFQTQVEGIRGQELQVMRKFAYLNSFSTFIFYCAPSLVGPSTSTPSTAPLLWWVQGRGLTRQK